MDKYLEALPSSPLLWIVLLAVGFLLISVLRERYRSYQRLDPAQFVMRPMFKKWAAIVFVAMLIVWAVFLILLERGAFR